jgi:hypothetical protein
MEEKQQIIDQEHLKLLSLFYYITGGITCLFSLIPLIHVAMGVIFVIISKTADRSANPPPEFLGWLFIIIGLGVILLGMAVGAAKIYAGSCIRTRRHYLFCLVMSAVICLMIPYGTILGIFSFLVLGRDSVKQLFSV